MHQDTFAVATWKMSMSTQRLAAMEKYCSGQFKLKQSPGKLRQVTLEYVAEAEHGLVILGEIKHDLRHLIIFWSQESMRTGRA